MAQTLIWLVPAALAWAAITWFFWRAGAWLLYFVVGSTGLALLAVVAARDVIPLEFLLRVSTAHAVNATAGAFGLNTSVSTADAGSLLVVGVPHHNEWTMLSIGLECSGLLESAALAGLIVFYPAQSLRRRGLILVIALAATFAANIVRMLVIVGAVEWFGQGALDFAHVVLGRLVFFALAIGIYWYAITRPTLAAVGARIRESR
ncbi:MAG: archaeosortase/exosortase family protein [Tepidiformaceae bacterium]